MNDPSLTSMDTVPVHVHKGNNYLRIFTIILLGTIILISVYSIYYVGFAMVPVILACLFGLLCIRFPKIYLYNDCFVVIKKCLIKNYTDNHIFRYNDLLKVEYSESFTDWGYLIVLATFGSGGYGGNSKADQMIITKNDAKTYIFNRFGSRKEFKRTIELINKNINSTNTQEI